MGWELVDAYDAETVAFLEADPVAHTVLLGVLRLPVPPGSAFAVLRRDGAVTATAWRTPPWPIGVTAVDGDDARDLGRLLVASRPDLADAPSVVGPAAAAAALAEVVAAGFGLATRPQLVETLYRLDGPPVREPRPVAGETRPARDDDVPLLAGWLAAFAAEAGTTPNPDPVGWARRVVGAGEVVVHDDGGPVSFVGARPTGGGVGRIGPVYTPPGHRGRGYAGAATAAAADRLFGAGVATVTLYADDANPTSTGIYRRLGFVPVAPWREVALHRS